MLWDQKGLCLSSIGAFTPQQPACTQALEAGDHTIFAEPIENVSPPQEGFEIQDQIPSGPSLNPPPPPSPTPSKS